MNEQQIEALVQKYAEGTATTEEVRQLTDWYRHASIEEVAWPADNAKEKDDVYQRMLLRLQESLPQKRGLLYSLTPLQAAAMLVLVLGAATLFYLWPAAPLTYTTISNSSRQIRPAKLPDGSMVWLNAATTLRYADDFGQHRDLHLDGEAYFDVKHDPEHPFIVESGGLHITVLGTRFNIRGFTAADRTIVTLLHGKVSIAASAKELAVLEPLTQLDWNRSSGKANTIPIDTTAVVAWKTGQLKFQGQPLIEIVQSLERRYGVQFKFANAGLGQCRYYMSFDSAMPLKDLLPLLTEITRMDFVVDKHSVVDKQTIVISGTGCQ